MRKLLLTSSALFLLAGGVAMAHGDGGSYVPIKNASAMNGSNSATTGGTAGSQNGNTLTNVGNSSSTSTSSESVALTKTLSNVGNETMSTVTTNTSVNMTLGTASNSGEVEHIMYLSGGGGGHEGDWGGGSGGLKVRSGDANMSYANNASIGISTVQQNTGNASLQQSSVALGSYVGAGVGGNNGF